MSSFVFIDSRVAGSECLIAGLEPGVEVVILGTAQDGVMQIAAALAGATDLDSIHIISHGASGTLYLGSTVLTEGNLDQYEDELALIGDALSEEGDLLLYGCNVAAGADGASFVASLAEYTGADVAASDDATGSAALGGDWQLEILTGAIESQPAIAAGAQDTYAHTLATITGDDNANDLSGTTGNDSISGLGGDDTLRGLEGNDTLDGGTGADSMEGGTGNDRYIIDDPGDEIAEAADSGADGIVTDQSMSIPDNVENLTYNNPTEGGGFFGNALDNVITGNHLDNTMGGQDGNDTVSYTYESNSVTVNLETGEASGSGIDTLFDFETVLGGSGADNITGDDVDNLLNGNGAADVLTGGFGGDTYVVDNVGDSVVETSNDLPPAVEDVGAVGNIVDTVIASIEFSLESVAFVENVTLSGTAASGIGNELSNVLTGNELANTLSGLANSDTLTGGGGNDTLVGGTGADDMAGGTNDDTYVVDATGDVVTEVASAGVDLIQSSISVAALAANVEKLLLTGSSTLNGTGNALANTLTGNAGANRLNGGDGNDTLTGGSGNDTMAGGLGNDIFVVNSAADVVSEAAIAGADLVQSSVSIAVLAANVENLTLTGSSALNGTGNTLANTLTGNTGANRLDGGSGNDTLVGGSGNDTMAGAAGNDTYAVTEAGDVVTEGSSGGIDLIQSTATIAALAANVEKLTLLGGANLNGTGNGLANTLTGNTGANRLSGGAGNDTVSGGSGNDTMIGGTGKDTVTGAGGNDTLAGSKGDDRLTGGSGADKFDFNTALSAATNVDRITDFNVTADLIRLDNDIFTALATGNLAKGAFFKGAGVTEAQDANDRIIYNTNNGNLFYDADGLDGIGAKLFATLVNEAAVTSADFFIVG